MGKMKDQEFIDIVLGEDESLAALLQTIVTHKRKELGTHAVYVQEVISTYDNGYTVILEISRSTY
ncbi:hypothetical protein FHE72_11670 [Rossellomorea vietnamensis]|uniref:Uncharacterized protein n=1 Tax=Rossellomorea vietnamensis TaxID=218284 RepID=A0A6I6USQ5_9BACI|nr:hypothetical protein [Rossellomorea vietnamensis]QHE61600.1 hypothetical protein FHE72_11670 [Rossellomorea vietnamensis]